MYSCHLFLISAASVRSLPFLSFIEPIFAWNVPLVSLIFLGDLLKPWKLLYVLPIFLPPCFSVQVWSQGDLWASWVTYTPRASVSLSVKVLFADLLNDLMSAGVPKPGNWMRTSGIMTQIQILYLQQAPRHVYCSGQHTCFEEPWSQHLQTSLAQFLTLVSTQ